MIAGWSDPTNRHQIWISFLGAESYLPYTDMNFLILLYISPVGFARQLYINEAVSHAMHVIVRLSAYEGFANDDIYVSRIAQA